MAKNTIFRVSSLKILTARDICPEEIERYGPYLGCIARNTQIVAVLNFIKGMRKSTVLMLLVNFSSGKSFVKNSECVKMWLTDEQETDTNLYKRRLSDGLFAIGRKRFVKTLQKFWFTFHVEK